MSDTELKAYEVTIYLDYDDPEKYICLLNAADVKKVRQGIKEAEDMGDIDNGTVEVYKPRKPMRFEELKKKLDDFSVSVK